MPTARRTRAPGGPAAGGRDGDAGRRARRADPAGRAQPEPDPVGEPRDGAAVGRVLVTASLILTGAALASRILGWIRLLVIGSQFGTSSELDAYFAAFRIPDAIFQLVVAGALSAALIPVFSSYRARSDEAEAWKLASSVINLVLIALIVLSGLMAIFAPIFVPIVAPGFDTPTTELTIRLTQIMLISPVLIGMGAVVSGILNSYQQFTIPSLAPLAYNLVIIAAAIFLAPIMGIEGLAVGVVIGSAAHLVIQLPSLAKVGRRYELSINVDHPGVRKVVRLMGPRMLGLAAGQLNFLVSTILASGLATGSLTVYNYAFQLSQLPVGIIGVSVAIALFPTMSQDAALGRVGEIRRQVLRGRAGADLRRCAAHGGDDRPARAADVGLLPVRRLQPGRRRANGQCARLVRGRPHWAHRRPRAGSRLLRHAGHADAGDVGDRRGRRERATHDPAGGADGRRGPGSRPVDQRPHRGDRAAVEPARPGSRGSRADRSSGRWSARCWRQPSRGWSWRAAWRWPTPSSPRSWRIPSAAWSRCSCSPAAGAVVFVLVAAVLRSPELRQLRDVVWRRRRA